MKLKDSIAQLKQEFLQLLADVKAEKDLDDLRIKFLSRQGLVAALMEQLKNLAIDEKKECGALLNNLKNDLDVAYASKKQELDDHKLRTAQNRLKAFDVTAVKPGTVKGHLHPCTHLLEKLEDVFISMGYKIVDGPELEDERHNFEALNIAQDHPARDMQDTFWLNLPGKLMRTQTSSVQIRTMENSEPPFAILSSGRVYRNEAVDATHEFAFMQAEGLFVDENVSMANLLATLKVALNAIFGTHNLDIRVRPGYFPFVEPGVEIDMECPFCTTGCSVCKNSRWIELGGAGLVHPNVLKACGIDANRYSGFAFGVGLTRFVMLKYGINDIRLLNSSRMDFLDQFS